MNDVLLLIWTMQFIQSITLIDYLPSKSISICELQNKPNLIDTGLSQFEHGHQSFELTRLFFKKQAD